MIQTQTKIFLHHSSLTFFEFSSSLLLEYGRKCHIIGSVLIRFLPRRRS